jgi:hypothetical protein
VGLILVPRTARRGAENYRANLSRLRAAEPQGRPGTWLGCTRLDGAGGYCSHILKHIVGTSDSASHHRGERDRNAEGSQQTEQDAAGTTGVRAKRTLLDARRSAASHSAPSMRLSIGSPRCDRRPRVTSRDAHLGGECHF